MLLRWHLKDNGSAVSAALAVTAVSTASMLAAISLMMFIVVITFGFRIVIQLSGQQRSYSGIGIAADAAIPLDASGGEGHLGAPADSTAD